MRRTRTPQLLAVAVECAGATLTLDLGAVKTVRAVQVNFADYQAGRFGDAPDIYTEFRLEHSADGRTWHPLARTEGPRRDRPNAYLALPVPVRTRYVRYVHGHVGAAHLAISDLRVFGHADGIDPAAPELVTATREADSRNAVIRWRRVPGAVGYNVRWGIRPDRLALTYQLFADRVAEGDQAALPCARSPSDSVIMSRSRPLTNMASPASAAFWRCDPRGPAVPHPGKRESRSVRGAYFPADRRSVQLGVGLGTISAPSCDDIWTNRGYHTVMTALPFSVNRPFAARLLGTLTAGSLVATPLLAQVAPRR
ncbi:discoidin domain-containing protein [Sphingomonas sp. I4]